MSKPEKNVGVGIGKNLGKRLKEDMKLLKEGKTGELKEKLKNRGKQLKNRAKNKFNEIKNTPASGEKRGVGKGVAVGENLVGRTKEFAGKVLRRDFKGAKDQLVGRMKELGNRYMPKKGPSGPSGPSGSDEHMENDARIGPLVAETAGSAAKAGMTLFKESIGAFISVMSNIANTARNRMTRRINQYGLNRTRKLGDGRSGSSGNHGNLSFNMNFDLDDPKQRGQVANLAGKMGDNIQKQLDSGKVKPDEPISDPGEAGTGEAGTGEAGTGEAGTGEDGTGEDGTGEAGTGEDGTGEAGTEGEAEEDNSDDWFKLIRQYYIANGEIVQSRAVKKLKDSGDFDEVSKDVNVLPHRILINQIKEKNPFKYKITITRCTDPNCDEELNKAKLKTYSIDLFDAKYTYSSDIMKKFAEVLDANKLSDCIDKNGKAEQKKFCNQMTKNTFKKNTCKTTEKTVSIQGLKKNRKYMFIPCLPIKDLIEIDKSKTDSDDHNEVYFEEKTKKLSCTKDDFNRFIEKWKNDESGSLEGKFVEKFYKLYPKPMMIRIVAVIAEDVAKDKKLAATEKKLEKATAKATAKVNKSIDANEKAREKELAKLRKKFSSDPDKLEAKLNEANKKFDDKKSTLEVKKKAEEDKGQKKMEDAQKKLEDDKLKASKDKNIGVVNKLFSKEYSNVRKSLLASINKNNIDDVQRNIELGNTRMKEEGKKGDSFRKMQKKHQEGRDWIKSWLDVPYQDGDYVGKTFLQIADEKGATDITKVLKDKGASYTGYKNWLKDEVIENWKTGDDEEKKKLGLAFQKASQKDKKKLMASITKYFKDRKAYLTNKKSWTTMGKKLTGEEFLIKAFQKYIIKKGGHKYTRRRRRKSNKKTKKKRYKRMKLKKRKNKKHTRKNKKRSKGKNKYTRSKSIRKRQRSRRNNNY